MRDLAEVYSRLARYGEAELLFLKALEGLQGRPKDDPIVVLTKSYLANMYAAQQRYDKAEPLRAESLDPGRRRFGQGHPEKDRLTQAAERIVALYDARGKPAELPADVFAP
jgi:hypothetical protein